MHKMLKDYLSTYTIYGNREELMKEDYEFKDVEERIEAAQNTLIAYIKGHETKDDVEKIIRDLDCLYWEKANLMEADIFEFGFNEGLKIGIEACLNKREPKDML